MSSTLSSGCSAPSAAYSAICPGPGNPARSGNTPEATPVVNTVLISRVPVYFTFAPVCCSHGATIFKNAACSSPPHVPITVTVLPLRLFSSPPPPPPLEQPAAASRRTVIGANLRNHEFTGAPLQLVVGQTSPRPARAPWQLTVRDIRLASPVSIQSLARHVCKR